MTPQQEQHLQRVKDQALELIDKKYRAGQAEHGGDLFEKSPTNLIDEAINEAIDQVVFLLTAKEKLAALKEQIKTHLVG